jgi:hypothetical protein
MTNEEFSRIVEERMSKIRKTLITKASEYATGGDRLYNFKRGSEITKEHPCQVCIGYMTKHLVSLLDLVEDLVNEKHDRVKSLLEEKLGDTLVYLFLLEALMKEYITEPESEELDDD